MTTKAKPLMTISPDMIVSNWCPHCEGVSVQVGELPDGWSEEDHTKGKKSPGHCLQCIADGGTCCDLDEFSRWTEEE